MTELITAITSSYLYSLYTVYIWDSGEWFDECISETLTDAIHFTCEIQSGVAWKIEHGDDTILTGIN